MSVLRCCANRLAWAHQLSAIDTTKYDQHKCEEQFYQTGENMPARCDTFELINPAGCTQCTHKGRITSPIQLGQKPGDQLPDGFYIIRDGPRPGLWFVDRTKEADDPKAKVRLGAPLFVLGCSRDADSKSWGGYSRERDPHKI